MILRTGGLAVLLAVTACTTGTDESAEASIVATPWPVAELVRELAGDAAVRELLPAGVEPHDAELTAEDFVAIESADVVVYVGAGFQPAVEDAVDGSRDLDVLSYAGRLRGGSGDEGSDPHVWLDPIKWADVAVGIAPVLEERLGRDGIVERAAEVRRDLVALSIGFTTALAQCPRDLFVTEHLAFGYLAERYDLRERALSGIAPDAEATALRIAALRNLAEDEGLTTVFAEPNGGRLARTLADAADLRVATLDPLEIAGEDGAGYEDRMRANVTALAAALGCA